MQSKRWDAEDYETRAGYVAELGADILDVLSPRRGERILDIGCGDGSLTRRIMDAGATVVAIDASEGMVARARERGLDARLMRGDALEFAGEFDAVFSNAALHWMPDADTVLAGVRSALKPGGRFVAELGGHGNICRIAEAIETVVRAQPTSFSFDNPWFFPTAEEYQALLERHGFTVDRIRLFDRPTPLPHGIRGWLEVFVTDIVQGLNDENRDAFIAACEETLRPTLYSERDGWWADYVRLQVHATVS